MSTYVFQPPDVFDSFNVSLHGITPTDVHDAPRWPDVCERLVRFSKGAPLVAHYAPFDLGVVRDACDACQIEWPSLRYACTVGVSRQVWPGLSSYSLLLLCARLGIAVDSAQHHAALYDARLAGALLHSAMETNGARRLADLLENVDLRFGEISPDGWRGPHLQVLASRANNLTPSSAANPDSPFYGKSVAFTGELAMVRRQAWALVADAGGQPAENVTKKTDFLVCGHQDLCKLAAGRTKSQKLRRAEELHAEGAAVEILAERDFFRLLDESDQLKAA